MTRIRNKASTVKSEDSPLYVVTAPDQSNDDAKIAAALTVLRGRLREPGRALRNSQDTADYARLRFAALGSEVFACLFLDTRHQVIEDRVMFHGTIDGASVYPREVVKAALQLNAAALIFIHNHPSGNPEPSQDDLRLTRRLREALQLVDIRVLDHLIVGGDKNMSVTSFAGLGYCDDQTHLTTTTAMDGHK